MEEVADLLDSLLACQHFEYLSYQAVFEQYLGLNPFETTVEQLQFEARQHLNIEMPRGNKDDWLNLLMSYFIEPLLGKETPVFIYDYPASQCEMTTLNYNETGVEIAEKFQLYYKGEVLVEGFKGLTDSKAMQDRLQVENAQRAEKGLKTLSLDNALLQAMEHGIPPFSAATVDLDKVLMRYVKANHLKDVISFVR
jgi:lysyl-tRNA synthetase class 2